MTDINETPEAAACEAACEETERCEETVDTQEVDAPDVQQIFMALSSVVLNELTNANAKYPEFYHSSNEGLGVIRGKYLKAEWLLRQLKVVGSQTFSSDFDELSQQLLTACVQLNVVTVKAIMSFCDTKPIAERFSQALKQQQQVAEMLHAGEQEQPADEPTV